jgi:ubiquinone biosynthesis protein UbiJ
MRERTVAGGAVALDGTQEGDLLLLLQPARGRVRQILTRHVGTIEAEEAVEMVEGGERQVDRAGLGLTHRLAPGTIVAHGVVACQPSFDKLS